MKNNLFVNCIDILQPHSTFKDPDSFCKVIGLINTAMLHRIIFFNRKYLNAVIIISSDIVILDYILAFSNVSTSFLSTNTNSLNGNDE